MELPKDFQLHTYGIKYEGGVLYGQKVGALEVGVKEEPIYVHIETDTDWATVIPAAAGVVVALLVAWLTIGVQRNQIQGSIANFRHQWMSDLREAGSELVQILNYLTNVVTRREGYKKEQEYFDKCSRASQLRAKVDLLLSRDDDVSEEIRKASIDAIKTASSLKFRQDAEEAYKKTARLKNLLRAELESAWEDMKDDLGVNNKFLFIRLFKKISKR